MKYKYEMHCHTAETSTCAAAKAKDTVEFYKSIGYSGLVVTDHYSFATFGKNGSFKRNIDADRFLEGYRCAREAAGEDFTVLLGMEIRFFATANDYLVYGIDEDFVRKNGNMLFMGLRRFHELVKESDAIIVQAHPFRPYISRANPKCLDGCEVFNSKDRDKNYNQKALEWAERENFKILTGGADYHRESQRGNASGIITEEMINTNAELVEILRSGRYRINMG